MARGDADEPLGTDIFKQRTLIRTLMRFDHEVWVNLERAAERIRLVDLPAANSTVKALQGSNSVLVEFHSTPSVDLTGVPWKDFRASEPLSTLQGVSFLVPARGASTMAAEKFFQDWINERYAFHPNDFNDPRLTPYFAMGEVIAGLAFAAGGPATMIVAAILSSAGSSGNMAEFVISMGIKGFGFGAAKGAMKGLKLDQFAKNAANTSGATLKNIDRNLAFLKSQQVFEEMFSVFFEEVGEWIVGDSAHKSDESY